MSDPIATHTVAEAMVWRNGFLNGQHAERERIIKLLETHAHDIPTLGACYDMDRPDFIKLPREDIDELIADIKGENK